jgi:NAD dependent epimerase/dehydratase family enzyme
MYSWVHIEDVCRMIEWLSDQKEAEGIYNCVAPNAVTNKAFMQTMLTITGNAIGLPAPAWLLEIGAWLIRTETELMLKSRWVAPKRSIQEGFVYKYDEVEKAIREIISGLPRRAYHLF